MVVLNPTIMMLQGDQKTVCHSQTHTPGCGMIGHVHIKVITCASNDPQVVPV